LLPERIQARLENVVKSIESEGKERQKKTVVGPGPGRIEEAQSFF
jgi:hypothetical protein